MKNVFVILILGLFVLTGCTAWVEHSEDKLEAARKIVVIAENGIPLAMAKIGFVNGVWVGRMDELPGQVVAVMDEYRAATTDPNNLTYEQAGYVIGLELRIDEIVFKKFLADNFPELLRYMP